MKKIRFTLILTSMIAILGFSLLVNIQSASALSGSEFNAGRIIDDATFFNGSSMNTTDIQSFLNAKLPKCDTWGNQIYSGSTTRATYGAGKGNPAPYTCLKDYAQNTATKPADAYCAGSTAGYKSSAQIIYEVAQSCGISPKVLIVLLQKEQSLITDDWPWNIQYRSATGYGCPDTAPCDAEYYGFFNQVYSAARGFKYYAANPSQFNYRAGRDNYILYNPNAGCGGSNIFIQNQATAGLYIYTPYQPNSAALSNLYGSGDSCSAYGNRNFWRMYNDWFGNPIGNGYEFVDAINPPTQINPNDVVTARIRIRNTSGATWYGDGNVPPGQHAFRLATVGYENTPFGNTSDPAWLGTKNQIKMQEATVANGGIATFSFTFKAPLQLANNYWTRFTPVYDGANFLPYIGMSFTTFTPEPIYSYQVTGSTGVFGNAPMGFTAPASFNIKNTGNVVWFNDNSKPIGAYALRLLTVNPFYKKSSFYDSSTWLAQNQISMNDSRVPPGMSTTFSFNLKYPNTAGTYTESLGLVLDGAVIYPDTSQIRINSSVSNYSYSIEENSLPSTLIAGQKYEAKISVKNTGSATWYSDGNNPAGTSPFRLMTPGYVQNNLADPTLSSWIGNGTQVKMTTASVAPGQTGDFYVKLLAPYNISNYNLAFRPVLDGVYILSGAIDKTVSIPVKSASFTQQPGGIHPSVNPVNKGQITSGKLIVKNTSNFVWYNDDNKPAQFRGGSVRLVMSNPYYRSSVFANPADPAWLGSNNQIKLTTPTVSPGEDAVFDFTWKAPINSGVYRERFTLVLDGFQLFPDIGMELVTTVL